MGKCQNNEVQPTPVEQDDSRTNLNQDINDSGPNVSARDDEMIYSLPAFNPTQPTTFHWRNLDGDDAICLGKHIYESIVHWKRYLFKVPSVKQGKALVKELAHLF